MKSLFKKELSYYLNNTTGYVIIMLFAVFANFLFIKDVFLVNSASMQPFFSLVPWVFVIFIPALSMRAIAEERRSNTFELLLSLSLSEAQIVVAKFLALWTVAALGLALTLGFPILLSFLSHLHLPEVFVGYLGLLCMEAAFISISMFFSSLTKNQVVAFLFSAVTLFLTIVVASDFSSSVLPSFLQNALSYFSPLYHQDNFTKGIIDLRSIFYFASVTAVFLFLTIIDLEKRD